MASLNKTNFNFELKHFFFFTEDIYGYCSVCQLDCCFSCFKIILFVFLECISILFEWTFQQFKYFFCSKKQTKSYKQVQCSEKKNPKVMGRLGRLNQSIHCSVQIILHCPFLFNIACRLCHQMVMI